MDIHKYDPEQAKLLQGFLGFEPSSTFDYTPEPFKKALPPEEWPVFTMRGMDGVIQAEIESQLVYIDRDTGRYFANSGPARLAVLRYCIRGWKNFRDVAGNLIPFTLENGIVPQSLLAQMPAALQKDLQDEISRRNALSEEEKLGLKS